MKDSNRSVETVFSGLKNVYEDDFPDSSFRVDDKENDTDLQRQSEQVEEDLMKIFSRLKFQDGSITACRNPRPLQITKLPIHQPHAYPCINTYDQLPAPPSKWPQSPVMLRPSPYCQTRIRGIRHADTFDYQNFAGFCAGCILPINNGSEDKSPLVIDFETKYFVGTLLLRIRDVPSATETNAKKQGSDKDTNNYFYGKKRRFQCVVKGRFKVELPMSRCVTGHNFQRPGGKLPAKMIVSAFIRFVSTLAPQLEANIDGDTPCFLAPLAATAHSVIQYDCTKDSLVYSSEENKKEEEEEGQDQNKLKHFRFYQGAGKDIVKDIEEPQATSSSSILPEVPGNTYESCKKLESQKVASRQKARKKALNQVSAKSLKEPVFCTNKEYCFEFYQHLLLFNENLAIDMGRPVGQVSIAQSLNGQPLQIMAAFRDNDGDNSNSGKLETLWNFELWHETLYPYAKTYHNNN